MPSQQLPKRIKDFVEWQLEHYHADKAELELFKKSLMPSGVQNYDTAGGRSYTAANPTEQTAMRILTNPYLHTLEFRTQAITKVIERLNHTQLEVINLVYWRRQRYTPTGAGIKVGMSKSSVYRMLNQVLYAIAAEMGYIDL